MSDFNRNGPEQKPTEGKKERSPLFLVFVGILVVLILSNLDALIKPFKTLNSILAPITIGLVLAYLLNPVLRFFELKLFKKVKRRTVNRALSMLCSYLFLLLLIVGGIFLIVPQVLSSIDDIRINGLSYVNRLIDSLNKFIASLPFDVTVPGVDGDNFITLEKLLTYVMDLVSDYGSQIVGNIGSIAGGTINILKNVIVGVFVSIYVLLAKGRLVAFFRRMIRAFLNKEKEETLFHYVGTANSKFGGFIVGKLVDSCMVGLTCALLFSIFKIPYPIFIAVIIGVTDFIPFFGPFIGAIPSAVIIFIASPSKALLFVILIIVVQQIDGNLIAPLILGDHTGLTSLGVLVSVTVMGSLLGFAGMLIGVPLAALLMTIFDDIVEHKLKKKGAPTDLYDYYPANAFIRPTDTYEKKEVTLTQRFVRWVRAVEEEEDAPDAPKTKRFAFSVAFRHGLLNVGYFFYRSFTLRPIPEDQNGSLFNEIARRGMKVDRTMGRTILFSVLTFGIYPLYLFEMVAESTNIACRADRKRTWGVLPLILLTLLTFGIYPLVWNCLLIGRFREYAEAHGKVCPVTVKYYLLWSILGFPILVGPFFAFARMLKAYNQMGTIFNETHEFPLSRESLEAEFQAAVAIADQRREEQAKLAKENEIKAREEERIAFKTMMDERANSEKSKKSGGLVAHMVSQTPLSTETEEKDESDARRESQSETPLRGAEDEQNEPPAVAKTDETAPTEAAKPQPKSSEKDAEELLRTLERTAAQQSQSDNQEEVTVENGTKPAENGDNSTN